MSCRTCMAAIRQAKMHQVELHWPRCHNAEGRSHPWAETWIWANKKASTLRDDLEDVKPHQIGAHGLFCHDCNEREDAAGNINHCTVPLQKFGCFRCFSRLPKVRASVANTIPQWSLAWCSTHLIHELHGAVSMTWYTDPGKGQSSRWASKDSGITLWACFCIQLRR